MTDKYIPAVGQSGYFSLRTPFDIQVAPRQTHTLKSVRKISDFIANNDDVYTEVYVNNGIPTAYTEDAKNDVEILGIQAEDGHWIYVPVTYVNCYPDFNGIPYRAQNLVVALQPIPVDSDLTSLLSQIQDLVKDSLGFVPQVSKVETSVVIQVGSTQHLNLKTARALQKAAYTPGQSNLILQNNLNTALAYIQALEQYIAQHPG